MANLLVLSNYPDKDFKSISSVFVYLLNESLKTYFDEVYVIAPTPWYPRSLAHLLGRVKPMVPLRLIQRDYRYDNVRVFFPRLLPLANRLGTSLHIRLMTPVILRTIRRNNLHFDLIHSHFSLNGACGVQLARRFDVPTVLTVHSNHELLMEMIRRTPPAIRDAWQHTDEVIRITPYDIPSLRRAVEPKGTVRWIPTGFDHTKIPCGSRESFRQELGLPADRFIFLSIGWLIPRKDPLIMIEALKRVIDAGAEPRPLLCFVGKDLMGGQVQQKVAEYGLGDSVRLLGQKSPPEVLRHIRASDAVLLYSHSEGLPCVMLESLGCGRPFIGSRVGGIAAVITDERVGLLGPPKDLEALTALLTRAVRTDWDEQYIERFAEQYRYENIARRTYEETYRPLLERRSRAK